MWLVSFFRRKRSLAACVSSLTKSLDALSAYAEHHSGKAVKKATVAHRLNNESMAHSAEYDKAKRMEGNIRNMLEA